MRAARAEKQTTALLGMMRSGREITQLEALKEAGCFRLASRIHDLRRAGHPIVCRMIHDQRTGKRYAGYRLGGAA